MEIFHRLELTLNLAAVNVITDSLGTPSINLTPDAVRSPQNLLDRPAQLLRHTLEPHRPRNPDDLVQRDALGMLDVLFLLAVAGRLLEGLDDECGCGGDEGDLSLSVLDGEAYSYAKAFLRRGQG